jgi:hypothetical protein
MHQAAATFRVRARGGQLSQFGFSFLTAYGAQRAAETARREEQELWAARNRLNRDVADIRRDRADMSEDEEHHKHWRWH